MQKKIREYSLLDYCLIQLDQGIRTIWGKPVAGRPNPAAKMAEPKLSLQEKRHSAGLMRVNHAGEISAQALYHAQALTARTAKVRDSMHTSAIEENDHLAWCEERLQTLQSHTSYLGVFWYLGSFALGTLAGLAGDKWSLGFVAETERQVVNHLNAHLEKLPAQDTKSREILAVMREDEEHHGTVAITAGAADLPFFVQIMMQCFSKVMTHSAYWV